MASLKKRDRVVTTGGVMGVVVDVFDDVLFQSRREHQHG